MSDDAYKTEETAGAESEAPDSGAEARAGRPMGFDCCGMTMGDAMAACPCSSIMRRHPVITSAFLGVMGLAVLVIPAGAILGIIAFFRGL